MRRENSSEILAYVPSLFFLLEELQGCIQVSVLSGNADLERYSAHNKLCGSSIYLAHVEKPVSFTQLAR